MKFLIILSIFLVEISTAQHVAYPLQVGNRWHYQFYFHQFDTTGYEAVIVGDTTFPNGKSYAIRNWQNPTGTWDDYLRQENETVYVYSPYSNAEQVLYQFNWHYGDSTCYRNCFGATTEWVLGRPLRVWTFSHGIGYDEVAESLGVVAYYHDFYPDRLIWAVIDGVPYGTIEDVSDNRLFIPKTVQLYQNFPNPFNPSTFISFSVSHSDWVNLSIFDLFGRQIAVLVNEVKYPGKYSIVWNPQGISSGVYYCSIQAGRETQTNRMIYLK